MAGLEYNRKMSNEDEIGENNYSQTEHCSLGR